MNGTRRILWFQEVYVRHRQGKKHRIRSSCPPKRRQRQEALGDSGNQRGLKSENLGRHALMLLKEQGCILEFGTSRRNDSLDRQQIDAWFITLKGKLVVFQIKSSERGVEKHLAKHPERPCVNLGDLRLPSEAALLFQKKFRLPAIFHREPAQP